MAHSGGAAAVPRGPVDRRAEFSGSFARRRLSAGIVGDHGQRALHRSGFLHRGRAAPRHGNRRRGSRRQAAGHSRRLGRRQPAGGADREAGAGRRRSALLVFPPAPFTLGQSPEMALAHFKAIADASDLPIIVFQYPLATGQGYPAATLERLFDEVPTIRAIKDWTPQVPQHESQIRKLQGRARPINVLSTNSAWLLSSLVLGCNGLLSGCGQRHRRSAGKTLPRRQGQRSRGSPPAQRPDLSDGARVLRRSLHRHAQPHEGSAGAARQTAACGGASAAGQDIGCGNRADREALVEAGLLGAQTAQGRNAA